MLGVCFGAKLEGVVRGRTSSNHIRIDILLNLLLLIGDLFLERFIAPIHNGGGGDILTLVVFADGGGGGVLVLVGEELGEGALGGGAVGAAE